jgi:hypothetical protein
VYREVTEGWAMTAGPSLLWVENGGVTVKEPVIEVPGETPRSPLMIVPVPATVTAEPPKTAKLSASPSNWANTGEGPTRSAANPTLAKTLERFLIVNPFPKRVPLRHS